MYFKHILKLKRMLAVIILAVDDFVGVKQLPSVKVAVFFGKHFKKAVL